MSNTLNYLAIITGLAGGLAFFLYGMRKMTDALKTVAGGGMKTLLSKLTTNRFTGAFAGALVTAVIQSSSITTVLVVGFITAGLMSFQQSIGVILGANIGTTITAQIIAFKVTKYALFMIAIGFFLELSTKREKVKYYGMMIMGLGLIFFGMELMSEATSPLRTYQPFIDTMASMQNPFFGIFLGFFFTALVQSSSATTGIVIVLASQGFISLEAGIALIFGSNIGTCVTALLASIGKPREAVRASVVHIIFNVLGVVLWIAFIPQFAELVRNISPSSSELTGISKLANETPRQIANAHTMFNMANAFLFLWFVPLLHKLVNFITPMKPEKPVVKIQSKFLDKFYLEQPDVALDRVKLELDRAGLMVYKMVLDIFPLMTNGSKEKLYSLQKLDEDVDFLHGEIITFLGVLSLEELMKPQTQDISKYIEVANHLENIGDIIESRLVPEGIEKIDLNIKISDPTINILKPLHEKICWAGKNTLQSLQNSDIQLAKEISNSKSGFSILANKAKHHLTVRLTADESKRLETFRIETNIIESFKQIHTYYRRIAGIILKPEKLERIREE